MQNGDHSGAIDYSMKSFIRILITSVFTQGPCTKTLGETERAIKSYQTAYQVKQDHAAFFIGKLKTYAFSENELNIMREQLKRVDLTLRDKIFSCIGTRVEAIGEYDEAFFHLDSAIRLRTSKANILLREWIKSCR